MDQKEVDLNEEQELSPEELAEFMASYKKELARIYKMSSAKKAFMVRQKRWAICRMIPLFWSGSVNLITIPEWKELL